MILFIIALYMLVMLLIGWWASKYYIKGMTDFLLAGRRLGIWLGAATLAATHFGGGAVMGGGEYGFKYGISGAWYGVSCGIGLLFLILTAEKFRALALYTVPDYLEERYGGKAIRLLGALLSIVALIGILAAQVLSARSALSIIGLKENTLGAIIVTLVFIIYTTTGGLWAVTLTDFIQIILASIGVIIGAAIVLAKTGGFAGLQAALSSKGVDPSFFSFWGMGTASIMWLLLPTVMYTLIGQDFYQRLFATKDPKTAKGAALLGGIVLVIISFFPTIIGMGAKALSNEDLGRMAVPWVLQNLMGPVLGGIVLSAILAAIMSTADSLLSAATSHIVKDLWIEVFKISTIEDETKLLRVSRVFTALIGVVSLLIALIVPGIIDALIYSYTMYTAGVFIPVIGGILWKKATKAGALVSLIVGSIVALYGILTGLELFGAPAEIYSALVSLVLFIVVSSLTSKK